MMTHQTKPAQKQPDRVMKPEQFSQVVEAIASGRYSWACVLILRFAGYNPLHYIPYRTYSRLLKENRQLNTTTGYQTNSENSETSPCLTNINDLTYLEPIDTKQVNPKGGCLIFRREIAELLSSFAPIILHRD
jgi:hypothetical protein